MPITKSDVAIYYETRGSRDGTPVLLIQGFGGQMIAWREGFCQTLVDRGAFVILFDNRDVGLSQKFGGDQDYDGGYALEDMAGDGFRVLDDLGLESAHLAGASMGGMIAQCMAHTNPARVRSLNLIHTTPAYDKRYFYEQGTTDPAELLKPVDPKVALERFIELDRTFNASPDYPYDEVAMRELFQRMHERSHAPAGILRQGHAVVRWAAVPEALGDLKMPASLIHGRADRRVRIEAALELSALLKTSEVHIYPGMGHEIPEPLWDDISALIMKTAARAAQA